jgi:LPPG:FO 2-phospho-L-lactate transferase
MTEPSVVVLSGGVGGAKLTLGLDRILPAGALTAVINTGDDFYHLGLCICPDIDTTLYTLSGLADRNKGWGRGDESWGFMAALGQLGGDTWFQLGDRDLALHVLRSRALARGERLSAFTADMAQRLGITSRILPMSDDPVATEVETSDGTLPFQEYFVRHQCRPRVRALSYRGADHARPAPGVLDALAAPDLEAVVIAPSNPYLSIDPILAVPGIREALAATAAPVIAVTPVIGGSAVKGPTTKIMAELRLSPSARTIADHYRNLIDGFLLDERDKTLLEAMPVATRVADTLMVSLEDRERVAGAVLSFARHLGRRPGGRRTSST